MFGGGGEHDLTEPVLHHLAGWSDSLPYGSGTAHGASARSTCTANCSARPSGSSPSSTRITPARRSGGSSWSLAPTPPPAGGATPTRASGRSAANPATSCTPSSCAGWRWTAPSRWPTRCVGDRVAEWRALADEIRDAILTGGWSASAKSFTRSFGSDDLDASNLMIPIVGFLPADDPRVLATIDAVADRLTDARGLVYRYRTAAGERRRPRRRGGHVPTLHVLARPSTRRVRTGRPSPADLRTSPPL